MGSSLTDYYRNAKHGLGSIDPQEATQLGEDWLIAGATGAAIGLVSAATGSLDIPVAGMKIPVDGLMAVGLGFAGLSLGSPELKTASIAAGGAASARTFGDFFRKGVAAHGDIEDGTSQMGMGWGSESDRLIEAAKHL
jgi:hypothetical protein